MSDSGYSPEEIRKRKLASDCFKRATEAMAKQNWDYAVEMLLTCAKVQPENLVYRQSLTGCLRKKYKDNKTGASMTFMKLPGIRSRLKKARSAKNWSEMDIAALEGHALNPWDGQFNADLGDAARQRDFLEISVFYYELAVGPDGAPKNVEFLTALADVHELRRNYSAAIATLERIGKLDPLNGSIRSKIMGLGADQTINRGRYDEAKSTQDVKEVKNEAPKQGYEESVKGNVKTTKEVLAPGESEEADLLRMTRKEPANVAHYLKLADFYRRNGKLEDSANTFKLALNVSNDPNIREQMEDVELDMVRRNLNFAKESASKDPSNEQSRLDVAELATELLQQEIEIFSRRVDRYPNDLRLKHELAKRYMRAKKFDKAIPLLQAASKDIRIEAQVLASLGSCFLAKKQNSLAKRQFEKALEKLNANDNPIPFKECHYYLGRLSEEAGDKADAEKHYTEILAIDYDYRDTVDRMTRIQGGDEESNQIDTGEHE
ncbi:tetratricopeptide repeat protein [Schlesneria paludicola]|uniref:tetratricopeptide repeat protein n=1 Tax=Schlesneria paludicola TaxID=360056 RepID=UPI00029A8436|nr:tetratricopeptide repeat protein [Schlesneria paludicola]